MAVFLGVFSAVLAVVALIVAYYQTKDLKGITKDLKGVTTNLGNITTKTTTMSGDLEEMSGDLEEVAKALPTRNIGSFPGYVKDLAAAINNAKSTVIIVCDAPCYCVFSDRDLWADYSAAVYKAKERFVGKKLPLMSIAWMDPPCRKEVLKEQFQLEGKGDWKSGIEANLARFLEGEKSTKAVDSIRYDEFEGLVETAHNRFIELVDSVPIIPVHVTLHLYFWITDDEAVFAIPNYADGGKGNAIWTRDAKIIAGLRAIHDRLRKDQHSLNPHAA